MMIFYSIGDHPEIHMALLTGYPSWMQEEDEACVCEECGAILEDDEVYEDEYHECLCEACLLEMHEKH